MSRIVQSRVKLAHNTTCIIKIIMSSPSKIKSTLPAIAPAKSGPSHLSVTELSDPTVLNSDQQRRVEIARKLAAEAALFRNAGPAGKQIQNIQ